MKNYRRFIVTERKNGLSKSVMNHGCTYHRNPELNYFHVIEYSAYADAIKALQDIVDMNCLEGPIIDNAKKLLTRED